MTPLAAAVFTLGGAIALGAIRRDKPATRLLKRRVTSPRNLQEAEEALLRFEDDLDTFKFDLGNTVSEGATFPARLVKEGRPVFDCRDLAVSWNLLSADTSGASKSIINAMLNEGKGRFDKTPVDGLTWLRFSEKAQLISDRMEVWRGDAALKCPNFPPFFRRSDPKNPLFARDIEQLKVIGVRRRSGSVEYEDN